MVKFNGREIEDLTIADVHMNDYPDFSDAHFDHAVWVDNGKDLTDDELEEFNDQNGDLIQEEAHESLH